MLPHYPPFQRGARLCISFITSGLRITGAAASHQTGWAGKSGFTAKLMDGTINGCRQTQDIQYFPDAEQEAISQ
jgi:hypothetical protein